MTRASLALLFLLPAVAPADTITVTGGKRDAVDVLVRLADKPNGNRAGTIAWIQPSGTGAVFVVPAIKAGETLTLPVAAVKRVSPVVYGFKENKGESLDLLLGEKPVLRFVNKPHDAANHYLTFKPFHQMFDPTEGKTILSSGTYASPKDGLFPHHRGLFFGFNKITYGNKQAADVWHGTNNVFSTSEKVTGIQTGEVFATHTAVITWHGKDGKTFAREERTVTVYNVPGGTLLDWSTELTTKLEKVRLDGDPQHAGFHFRATQEVSKKTAKQTYYLRPDGKGKEGETRNWDAKKKDPKTVNLPWNAMSFVTNGKRHTALRINHPDNPGETRGSERDYGRFGDYFEYDLTPTHPLKLKYRVWLQEGEMTVAKCQALAAGFTDKFAVKVSK